MHSRGGDPVQAGGPDQLSSRAWTVAEVVNALKSAVEGTFEQIWVRGEVTDLKVYQSGHWYFTLRDADAQIRCVIWKTYAQRLKSRPAEGTEVYLLARASLWEEKADLRLAAVAMLPTAGVGLQQLALERTREALARDGLFEAGRKRSLPPFPHSLVVITSLEGAALHDMVTVARRRWPSLRLYVIGSAVQGEQAERELVRALGLVNRMKVDACIVGRGGGSREDLGAFNLESVCRAIAAVRVPVIAAIGHETDVSFADLVADLRAPTPSAAMEMAVPDRRELLSRLATLGSRLGAGLGRRTRLLRERLYRAEDRLRHRMATRVAGERERLTTIGAQLDALSPLRVLGRGYAVPRNREGRVLRRREEFTPALGFVLRVSDGDVNARVEEA